ncbi:MAG TPA: hypothetical protein VK176_04115 [Phycisphaerales bacterium]|nr:hypothetical protein [Phycisphaerales bacterium]
MRIVEWTTAGLRVAPATIPEELAQDAAVEVIPLDSILTVSRADPGPAPPTVAPPSPRRLSVEQTAVTITLIDGQRLIGGIPLQTVGGEPLAEAQTDAILIESALMGRIRISFEEIASIDLKPVTSAHQGARDSAPPQTDAIILANGDTVRGFIESISQSVTILTSADSKDEDRQTFPISRCAQILFANPQKPLMGQVLWIGERGQPLQVVRLSEFSFRTPGQVSFRPVIAGDSSATINIPLNQLAGIMPQAQAILPLSSLPRTRAEPASSRPWSQPPAVTGVETLPLGLGIIEIPGAMTIEWRIPDDASALLGRVRLNPDAVIWGDCNLTLELVDASGSAASIWSGRLYNKTPEFELRHTFERATHGRTLRARLESGEGGDVQDRVLLDSFLFIVTPQQ